MQRRLQSAPPVRASLLVDRGAPGGLRRSRRERRTADLPTEAAPPQAAELGWTEQLPRDGRRAGLPRAPLRGHPERAGRRTSRSRTGPTSRGAFPGAVDAVPTSFGVMLFRTDELDEVEQRSADGDLPGLRAASTYDAGAAGPARARRALARDDRRPRLARGRALRPVRARPVRRGRRSAGGDRARLLVDHRSRAPAESLSGKRLGTDWRERHTTREARHERTSRPLRGAL